MKNERRPQWATDPRAPVDDGSPISDDYLAQVAEVQRRIPSEERYGLPWLGISGLAMFGEPRTILQRQYAFAIPNADAIDALAGLGPIVEMGAGTGYWAHLLRKRGVDIVAYDRAPGPHPDNYFQFTRLWTDILVGGPEVLGAHADRALFLCWPDYSTEFGIECLQSYSGSTVAYVGEGTGGCTADDAFHEHLAVHFRMIRRIDLPQWFGVHDDLYLYQRNKPGDPPGDDV